MHKILEGSKIHTREELHDALAEVLALPDYYGRNLDALWDCLTGWIETPLRLTWRDYEPCRHYLGEYAEKALELFRQAEVEVDGFTIEIRP